MNKKKFFGWVLIVIGSLTALGAGGCTVAMLKDAHSFANAQLPLLFGGGPCVLGILMVIGGLMLAEKIGSKE